MPEQRLNLNDILRNERKSKLVPLGSDFYEKVAGQLRELEAEKSSIEDISGSKYAIIDDELRTARKSIENIIERRIGKIIKEASLHASSKQKADIDSMTAEERGLYNKLLELMMEWRGALLDKVFKKERQPPPSAHVAAENAEDKKDISKEYIVVRLLRDIPTFVGVDGRNYTLAKEDVVVLSAVNAKALINRNAAVQIKVKR